MPLKEAKLCKDYYVTMVTRVYRQKGDIWERIDIIIGNVYFRVDVLESSIGEAIKRYIQDEIKNKTITIEVTEIREIVKTFQQKELLFGGQYE